MFERFTNRAKEVMLLAAQEAQRLGHQQIGTPHVLLALIHEGRGVAMVAMAMMNLDFRHVVQAAQAPANVPDDTPDAADGEYTPAVRRMIARAAAEADELEDDEVGTEHLLLALLNDKECRATQILMGLGLRPEVVRTVLTSLLASASDHAQAGELPGVSDPDEAAHAPRLSVQLSAHASQVDALANEEAHRLNHDWVATEHLLLALLRDAGGNAAQLLRKRGIDLRQARHTAERLLPVGSRPPPSGRLPLTLGAQHVLQYAVQQARPVEQDTLYVATEHLLLGILRESKSIAGEMLRNLGVDMEAFRQEVETLIDSGDVPPEDD